MTIEERLAVVEAELEHLRELQKLRDLHTELLGGRQERTGIELGEVRKILPSLQTARKELEETAIVMSGIQARQAALLKDHAEWLQEHDRAMTEARERGKATDERIDKLVSAIGEMLRQNGSQ